MRATTHNSRFGRRLRWVAGPVACALTLGVLLAAASPAAAASSTLGSGGRLNGGGEIAAGSYRLVMQGDGNLVEYTGSTALWSSHTSGQPGNYVVMQTDGNLVVRSSGGSWRWQSTTLGHPGAHLSIQTDGNVVVRSTSGAALWAKSWIHTASGAQAFAKVLFVHYGWSVSSQYTPLYNLWTRESNWRWNVCNGGALYPNCPYTSVAYGIPQALPGTKMSANGPDWATDGLTQVAWGEAYIHSVYGTPQAAWNHELNYGWY